MHELPQRPARLEGEIRVHAQSRAIPITACEFCSVSAEFQSRVDHYMPVRVLTYAGLLYQDLIRTKRLPPSGPPGPSVDLSSLFG
jgi:hypothetical protein